MSGARVAFAVAAALLGLAGCTRIRAAVCPVPRPPAPVHAAHVPAPRRPVRRIIVHAPPARRKTLWEIQGEIDALRSRIDTMTAPAREGQ